MKQIKIRVYFGGKINTESSGLPHLHETSPYLQIMDGLGIRAGTGPYQPVIRLLQ